MHHTRRRSARRTPSEDTHAKGYEETAHPTEDAPAPREGEDGETDIFAKQEDRGLLPRERTELDLMGLLLESEGSEGVNIGDLCVLLLIPKLLDDVRFL